MKVTRRDFSRLAGTGVLAAAAPGLFAPAFAQDKPRRVGLIGCGWYGKADLFRLAYLAARGGIYADADDRCLAPLDGWIHPGATLVARCQGQRQAAQRDQEPQVELVAAIFASVQRELGHPLRPTTIRSKKLAEDLAAPAHAGACEA